MKYIKKTCLLFLLSCTITSCSIYKKHFGTNQDYTKDHPGQKLKTNDNQYPLIKSGRYEIPKISGEFKQPISDLNPPDYNEPKEQQEVKINTGKK